MEHIIPPRETELEKATHNRANLVAAVLSLVPGMGHISKGDHRHGWLCFSGAIFVLALSILAAGGTLGLSPFLIPLYWLAVGAHAFGKRSRSKSPR